MKLNHVSNRVTLGSLELMVDLFTSELGFRVLRLTDTDVWMKQEGANIDIQFCETEAPAVKGDKYNSHISLLSDTPRESLEGLARWFEYKGEMTELGSWSEKEFWLDAPDIFVDFVL